MTTKKKSAKKQAKKQAKKSAKQSQAKRTVRKAKSKRGGRSASHTDAEIVKAAKRFYEHDENQKTVGKKMKPKIVASYVSRILKDAKAAGKFKVVVVAAKAA